MAHREMTAIEIAKRIGQGDLVVYMNEEYDYRRWYWFPDMSESDLVAHWEKCNIADYYFDPSKLPGNMVPVPGEDVDEDELENYYHRAYQDKRAHVLTRRRGEKHKTDEELDKAIAVYDEWQGDWFPNEAMWAQGWGSKTTWRAHVHMEDDSYLKKPEQ